MIGRKSYILVAALVLLSVAYVPVQAKEKANPKVVALLSKGYVFYKVKNYKAALKYLDQALAIDPRAPGLFFMRAEIRKKTGDLQNAVTDYETAALYLRMQGKEKQAQHLTLTAESIESAIKAGKEPPTSPIPKQVQALQYKLEHPSATGVLNPPKGAAIAGSKATPIAGAQAAPIAISKPKAIASTDKSASN